MKNTNKVFMAFAKGTESTEGTSIKRYIGVAPVTLLSVNPDKATLETLYNTTLENSPEYISEGTVSVNGVEKTVEQVRLDFIAKVDETKTGVDMTTRISFFLRKEVRYNKDATKVQVINKYGEVAWFPVENAKNGTVPDNLTWFEAGDFRPAYIGEEELTGFIKAYLNIPNKSYRKANGEVVTIPNKADAEARLDNIAEYFKGNFSELQGILTLQPNNKVKVLFGVRNTDDNKQYQAVYTQMFLRNSATDYSRLQKNLEERKAAGSYPTTEFVIGDLKEYSVESTTFTSESTTEAPATSSSPWG